MRKKKGLTIVERAIVAVLKQVAKKMEKQVILRGQSKSTFQNHISAGVKQVIKYLGQHTHKIAISNTKYYARRSTFLCQRLPRYRYSKISEITRCRIFAEICATCIAERFCKNKKIWCLQCCGKKKVKFFIKIKTNSI